MCLAVPGQLVSIEGEESLTRSARVAFSGVIKDASLALLPEAKVGDYVLVHAGFAITLLDEAEAKRSLDYLDALDGIPERPEQAR